MKNALDLLSLAVERFPSPPNCTHSLTRNASGRLVLTISSPGPDKYDEPVFKSFSFDEADFALSPEDIINQVETLLSSPDYVSESVL
jgi:hypothetical protein